MKKLIASLTLATMAACPLAGFAQADIKNDPAYLPIDKFLDVKAIPPQVDVNLPGFLLKDALSGLDTTNLGDSDMRGSTADLKDLVKDVKLIRVLVFEGSKSNRKALAESMKPLQAELNDKWTAVVHVKDDDDNVGIFVKGDASGDSVGGLAVLVHSGDDGDTIIVNVVGHVSLGKVMKLASQSNKLPKGLLQQLMNSGAMQGGPPASEKKKTESGAGKDKPLEAPGNATNGTVTK